MAFSNNTEGFTKARAIRILIANAAANVRGAGCGIREAVTEEKRKEVVRAIRKMYVYAYGFPFTDNEKHNFGL